MALALEIAFAAAVAVVAGSLVAVAFTRVPARLLLGLAVGLGVLALAGAVVAGIEIADGNDDSELLLVTVGGLVVAALCRDLPLSPRARTAPDQRVSSRSAGRFAGRLDAYLDQHAEERTAELERILARERAEASHALGEQERQLAEERRDAIARQAEHARVELTEAVSGAQGRLETRLDGLGGRPRPRPARARGPAHQARASASRRRSTSTTHACAPTRSGSRRRARSSGRHSSQLRAEFERLIAQFVEEGRTEVEAHAAERRRALHEVSERLREPRARPSRADRPRGGRVPLARRRRPGRGRASAARPAREGPRPSGLPPLRGCRASVRRADQAVAREVSRATLAGAGEVDRGVRPPGRVRGLRPDRPARARRPPTGWSAASGTSPARPRRRERSQRERLRHVSERLDAALAAAEQRIAAYEEEVDVRLDAKLGHVRAGRQGRRARLVSLVLIETNSSPQETSPRERTDAAMDQLTLLDETAQDERGKVESWRLHVLIEAGYPLPLAERLASSHADLHLAVELVDRRGCAPETAAEILL